MSGVDLMLDIQNKTQMLDTALGSFRKRGEAVAAARRAYKMELSKAMLIKREEGVPVSILKAVCEGLPEIAELGFALDTAITLHDSAKETINVNKLEIKVLNDAIEREWHSA